MASRMLDLPDPLRPAMALNDRSYPVSGCAGYILKPVKNAYISLEHVFPAFDDEFLYLHPLQWLDETQCDMSESHDRQAGPVDLSFV